MIWDSVTRTLLGLCAAVLVFAALEAARSLLAPVAFALFIIAIVWPFQRRLQAHIPQFLALLITILVVLVVISSVVALLLWGMNRVGQWLAANYPRFQELYLQAVHWLEGHGISLMSQVADTFDASWLLRALQEVGGRLHGLITFTVITLTFTILGLLEVDVARNNISRLENRDAARTLLAAGAQIATKFQKYMLVRSVMSALTGAVIWAIALLAGLELATAWGVIAFVFNYIPFIGSLFATIFPTLFALAQFESVQLALAVLVCLNLVQFGIGSYLEPRMAGATLSISPFLVLFAIFFWSLIWGIAGAFIGVPIVIAAGDPAKPIQIKLALEYGICLDICVPAEATLELVVPADAKGLAPHAGVAEAVARVPRLERERGAGDPKVVRKAATLTGEKPTLELEVEFPGGVAGADVFVDGPEGVYVPQPKRVGDAVGKVVAFRVALDSGVDPKDLAGKELRLTMVSAAGASEATWQLD